jgi:hypothetical protein
MTCIFKVTLHNKVNIFTALVMYFNNVKRTINNYILSVAGHSKSTISFWFMKMGLHTTPSVPYLSRLKIKIWFQLLYNTSLIYTLSKTSTICELKLMSYPTFTGMSGPVHPLRTGSTFSLHVSLANQVHDMLPAPTKLLHPIK